MIVKIIYGRAVEYITRINSILLVVYVIYRVFNTIRSWKNYLIFRRKAYSLSIVSYGINLVGGNCWIVLFVIFFYSLRGISGNYSIIRTVGRFIRVVGKNRFSVVIFTNVYIIFIRENEWSSVVNRYYFEYAYTITVFSAKYRMAEEL